MLKKIAIFGPPATGKTTLARALSTRLGLPHTALDHVLFTTEGALPLEEFRAQAAEITAGEAWIVEGNFSKLADVVWHRADVLVWLDFSLPLISWRIIRRSLRQLTGREPNTHRLTWRTAFLTRRSMLRNAIRKYRNNRTRYTRQAEETAALGVRVLRFRTPRDMGKWLSEVTPP